jgi:hypothetical protein
VTREGLLARPFYLVAGFWSLPGMAIVKDRRWRELRGDEAPGTGDESRPFVRVNVLVTGHRSLVTAAVAALMACVDGVTRVRKFLVTVTVGD